MLEDLPGCPPFVGALPCLVILNGCVCVVPADATQLLFCPGSCALQTWWATPATCRPRYRAAPWWTSVSRWVGLPILAPHAMRNSCSSCLLLAGGAVHAVAVLKHPAPMGEYIMHQLWEIIQTRN